ncbi:glycosyltransferase [Mixta tenebrionis]|uniref:Glycosyltransferase n=1 Tax=Mixta tenebrionis TaxID=2562439 RepID=A0A506V9G0_9GAMM|nr:glycosyltransferase [Mixta tenebrionis]TPW42491.1 glycosyltransferase [Mixta tenebrionis]
MDKTPELKETFEYDVLICTFNGATYIDEQISSILKQVIKPVKIIISDDGSTDQTIEKCKICFDRHSYTRYQIIRGPQAGIANNFIYGMKYSTAEHLFFSDQDDVWLDDKVSCFADAFYQLDSKKPILLFSDAYVVDSHLNILSKSFINYAGLNIDVLNDDSILLENCVQGASSCINGKLRDLILESITYIANNSICMHDWWVAIMARYYGISKHIDKPLIYYRQHNCNQIGALRTSNCVWKIKYVFRAAKKIKNYVYQLNQAQKVFSRIKKLDGLYVYFDGNYDFSNLNFFKKIIYFVYR